MFRHAVVLAVVLGGVAVQSAQDPAVTFDVVSVRPNTSVGQGGSISAPVGGQFRVVNLPLRSIIVYAYDLRNVQLVGPPDWTRSERFDITATFPKDAKPKTDARAMLRNVLADRFNLKARRETRDVPIYRLALAHEDRRLGPNLVSSDVDCVKWLADKKPQFIGTPPIGPGGARPACLMVAQRNYVVAGAKPLTDLALALESVVDRPVVDTTGLPGNFDFSVQWTPTPTPNPQTTPTSSDLPDSVFTALQEQLGLKLEPARGPVEVLVIDSVERPTPD